jgi:hypothetical protein
MNWPEATAGMKSDSPCRIRAANQIRGIFREDGREESPAGEYHPADHAKNCRQNRPPVLFRYSLTVKLMQKIHSLTDN